MEWGVQEKRVRLRNTVSKSKIIFFILFGLRVDNGVAGRYGGRHIFKQHEKGKAGPFRFGKCGVQQQGKRLLPIMAYGLALRLQ